MRRAESDPLAAELAAVLERDPVDLARAALVIARLEYPRLDFSPSLERLRALGARAAASVDRLGDAPARARIAAVNRVVFEDEGFAGNRAHYGDFRNSLLNVVLERRLGIPITLAVVYIDVARRAGLEVAGVAFPGHFLVRVAAAGRGRAVLLDPFAGGVELDEPGCRDLLARAMGDDSAFADDLLRPCSPRQLVTRMLNNLKRTYIELRSFPQARRTTDLLICADPTLLTERRDRGLLAYHLSDFPAALDDLDTYLRLTPWTDDDRDERDQVVEHIKSLRRRVGQFN